ncbi:hypothetical protein B5S28_g5123 [[Candida] boidinii]|uniref:Unnamed protein product n=2 Tax=Candida boidinii TaxID=5477 RepID=A0ACB5TQY8_CANBO|nr:hypothetical protein B5S28_g5123 [[Candida] boidinii]OWB64334.1 hypothetical protein B5S29_g5408 [[Candida] boidinii]OWB74868.1 hypothetical protein B5S31_g4699 [[Candida] boidinii]OWB80743.1 hypothetical protein B5S32_g5041 [[Candida] boidinii]BAC81697.2 S-formylglutathione hydrolase [[Candida] boidinii]
MSFKIESEIASFGGQLIKLSHESPITNTKMDVNIYLPKKYFELKDKNSQESELPVLLYLSGLTCTPNNASEKAFWQPYANEYGFAVVLPDTSPRGAGIEGEDESWDFGTGAGFYVDSIKEPWNKNYNMYSYILKDLLPNLKNQFKILNFDKISITGHSMGGYGAMMFYLKNPGYFKSCSAFAPISNPSKCKWGEKCFGNYLGDDQKKWLEYDPTELIKNFNNEGDDKILPPILIHTGKNDPFYYRDLQLLPENLIEASKESKVKVDVNLVDGYDHSYYFISSFTKDHAAHHAKYLGLSSKL